MLRRITPYLFALIALIGSAAAQSLPPTGGLVQFETVGAGGSALRFAAYLARPRVAGRQPAVVVLHGCSGMSGYVVKMAIELASWGYVALAPDSLTPRGIENLCDSALTDQARDAYAALRFLKDQTFVDPARIAVLGASMGGIAALGAVESGGIEEESADKFRAAVAYYPLCVGGGGVVAVPTLILIGEKDDWTPAQICRDFMKVRDGKGAPLELIVLPDAYHGFNISTLPPPGVTYFGHHLEYNEPATRQAEDATRQFLQRLLSGG